MTHNIKGLAVSVTSTGWQALTSMTVWIFYCFCKQRTKPGENLKQTPKHYRRFIFSLSPDRQCRASSKWKGKKEMVENIFFFIVNEWTLNMPHDGSTACKIQRSCCAQKPGHKDKLTSNLVSCKCFWGMWYLWTQPAAKCKPDLVLYTGHVCGEQFSSKDPLDIM